MSLQTSYWAAAQPTRSAEARVLLMDLANNADHSGSAAEETVFSIRLDGYDMDGMTPNDVVRGLVSLMEDGLTSSVEIDETSAKGCLRTPQHCAWELLPTGELTTLPDLTETQKHARRMRATMTKAIAREVFERDGWRCLHCDDTRNLTVDHVVPVITGGTNDLNNLQTLCGRCNSSKGAQDLGAWLAKGGRR